MKIFVVEGQTDYLYWRSILFLLKNYKKNKFLLSNTIRIIKAIGGGGASMLIKTAKFLELNDINKKNIAIISDSDSAGKEEFKKNKNEYTFITLFNKSNATKNDIEIENIFSEKDRKKYRIGNSDKTFNKLESAINFFLNAKKIIDVEEETLEYFSNIVNKIFKNLS